MLTGANLRNEEHLKPEDTPLYQAARFECAVAFWYQLPDEVLPLVGDPATVIMRLEDTFHDNRILGQDELTASWQETIDVWYARGVRHFVLDNEPNDSWSSVTPPSGKTRQWFWAWLVRRVLEGLRLPQDVVLLLTPIAQPSLNGVWLDETTVSEPGFPSIASYCKGAAAHCYWQAEEDMEASWAGRCYRFVHDKTGLPVYITESGCSSTNDTLNRQIRDYPQYYCKVDEDSLFVPVLIFYILGHNGDWALFNLTAPVCASIGSRAEPHNPTAGGGGTGTGHVE